MRRAPRLKAPIHQHHHRLEFGDRVGDVGDRPLQDA
jgi:hypothetical protein